MWNAKRTSALIVLICICVLLNSWLGYLRKIQHKPMRNEAHPTYQPSYRSVRPEPNTTQSVSPTRGMNQHKHKTEKEKEEEDKVRVWQRNRLPTILPRGDAGGSVTRGAPKRQRSPPPNLKGRVHSTWNHIANKHAAKWYLSLKDVSFRNGTLHIHLPPSDNRSMDGMLLPYDTMIEHTPLDLKTCTTMETRHIVHSFPCHRQNCYMTNFGHLLINVLNPLFTYLYFVHENITSLKNESVRPHLLPLSNTLLLFKSISPIQDSAALAATRPAFLFDVALRFASDYGDMGAYFKALESSSKDDVHCFRSFSMPVFIAPERRFQEWDAMHWSLRGRWGTDDFYYNFWRETKRQILQLYDIPVPPSVLLEQEQLQEQQTAQRKQEVAPLPLPLALPPERRLELPVARSSAVPVTRKPKVLWMERGTGVRGRKGARTDQNIRSMSPSFSPHCNFHVFDASYYQWHVASDMRYNLSRNTLLTLQSADIVMGITGSNMQGGLFLREQTMLVDVKTAFCYCSNEGGKAIANHNHMAFYQSHVLYFAVATPQGHLYNADKMAVFAKEVSEKWAAEQQEQQQQQQHRGDGWRAECSLAWPDQDPLMPGWGRGGQQGNGTALLTRREHSRCYLDYLATPAAGAWYQLAMRSNRNNCEENQSASLEFGVSCFRKDLC